MCCCPEQNGGKPEKKGPVFGDMNFWERHVVGGGRMWWNTSGWDGGVGEGCGGSSRGSRANGRRVGGVTCGWRGGTLLQRRQMPSWLDFISHRQTPQSMPNSRAWACEHHNLSASIRQDVLSHFPDESHPASSAPLLSFTVLASSEASAAGLSPHCSKKKKKKSCEKVRERARARRARWRKSSVTFGSVLHYWLWLMWSEEITEIQYSHKSPLRLFVLQLSLSQPHVWDTQPLSAPPGHRETSVSTFSLWIISILVIHLLVSCNQTSVWSPVHFPTYSAQDLPTT